MYFWLILLIALPSVYFVTRVSTQKEQQKLLQERLEANKREFKQREQLAHSNHAKDLEIRLTEQKTSLTRHYQKRIDQLESEKAELESENANLIAQRHVQYVRKTEEKQYQQFYKLSHEQPIQKPREDPDKATRLKEIEQLRAEIENYKCIVTELQQQILQERIDHEKIQDKLSQRSQKQIQHVEKQHTQKHQELIRHFEEDKKSSQREQQEQFDTKMQMQYKQYKMQYMQMRDHYQIDRSEQAQKHQTQMQQLRSVHQEELQRTKSVRMAQPPMPRETYTTEGIAKWILEETRDIPDHIRLREHASIYLLKIIANYGTGRDVEGYKLGETRKGIARRMKGINSSYKCQRNIVVICALSGRTLNDEQLAKKKFDKYKKILFVDGSERDEFYTQSKEILRHFYSMYGADPDNGWFNPNYLRLL